VGSSVGVEVAVGGRVALGKIISAVAGAEVKVGAGVRVIRTISLLTLKNQAKSAVAPKYIISISNIPRLK
jgi:hypothetical protein